LILYKSFSNSTTKTKQTNYKNNEFAQVLGCSCSPNQK